MPVFKRFQGKKVQRGDKNYNRAKWIMQGQCDGQRYHQACKSARTKAEAEQEEDLLRARIRNDEYAYLKDKTSFKTFVEEVYLPYAKTNNTNFKTKVAETNSLLSFFGENKLAAISSARIEQYKRNRLDERKHCQKCENDLHDFRETCDMPKISASTINRELTTLSAIMTLAVQDRRIKENPCRHVKKFKEPPPRDRLLSKDEKTRLLLSLNSAPEYVRAIVQLALSTGWRKGQILGLTKEAIDFERQAVTIIASKDKSARKVPVGGEAFSIIEALAERVQKGNLFSVKSFDKAWNSVLKRAGIAEFKFHDCRHVFATELLHKGVDGLTLQKLLGHSRLKTTEIYAQTSDDLMRRSLEKIDILEAEVLEG